MRDECPVCRSRCRYGTWKYDFGIPDDWTLPNNVTVCACANCGFIYYDAKTSQEDYDTYYKDKYGFGCFGEIMHQNRLDGLAKQIIDTFPKGIKIADFGGGDGYLVGKLNEAGFNAVCWDLGQDAPENCDLIVASHVIEHVWDLDDCIYSLKDALVEGGKLMVEIPDAYLSSFQTTPPILDYNWVHVNHFAPFHLDLLFNRFGFTKCNDVHIEYRENDSRLSHHCYRAVYELDYNLGMYVRTNNVISKNINTLHAKMMEINEPVIAWGCGAIMLLILAMGGVPVVYMVDDDVKSFPEGTWIKGVPVLNEVVSDHPIMVCAMGQKQAILDRIKSLGLKNRVIVVDL